MMLRNTEDSCASYDNGLLRDMGYCAGAEDETGS